MRVFRWVSGIISIGLVATLNLGVPAHAAPTVDPNNADSVRAAYRRLQELTNLPHDWSGNAEKCVAGTTAPGYDEATGEAINIVRAMAGLKPVKLSAKLNAKAREAALLMLANRTLTHTPTSDMKCFTANAKEAAGYSNLSYGPPGANAILAYMRDAWHNNAPVGHRRWLLRPETSVMGVASTAKTNVTYVIGGGDGNPGRPWVAWPTAGYFPSQLVPDQNSRRWSLSAAAAWTYDFTAAKVSVKDESGRNVPLTVLTPVRGYAHDTIVWEMDPPPAVKGADVATYTVRVSNIRKGSEVLSHSYQVKLVDGDYRSPAGSGNTSANNQGASASPHIAPQLTSHQPGRYYPAGPAALAGRGTPGATIRLKLGSRVRTAKVEKNGKWRLGEINMAAQGFDLTLTSTLNGKTKSSSYALHFGPAPKAIAAPVVNSHRQNACHVGSTSVRFTGRGTPGTKITLLIGSRTRVAWVRANGHWSTGAVAISPNRATKIGVHYTVSAPGFSDVKTYETYTFAPSC
ncbi:MAG: CAP domain-containing protein [Propionibacteriaceae bacterium]|nr:CAP domain-containing protein [Propionibacteriaceae bacterium]